jgi:hypothetical protein
MHFLLQGLFRRRCHVDARRSALADCHERLSWTEYSAPEVYILLRTGYHPSFEVTT